MTKTQSKSIERSPRHAAAELAEVLAKELPKNRSEAIRLPSRRQIADRFEVSLPTVTVALKDLQRRKLIYWIPGKGMFCGGPNGGRQRLLTIGLLGWFSHVEPTGAGPADTYRMYLLHDLMAHAGPLGCQITVIPHDGRNPIDAEQLRQSGIDALLLKDMSDPEREIPALRRGGMPLLSDSTKFAEYGIGYVGHDIMQLMREIVQVFASRGHRKIAFIANETSGRTQNRTMREVFFASLMDVGLIYDYNEFWRICPWEDWKAAHSHEFLYEFGLKSARELLSRPDRPTAIFAWQPQIAAAIHRVAQEMGLSVPEDVSILTDVPEESATQFSTFVHPHSELAKRLLDCLLQVIDDPDLPVRELIPRRFVDKGSIQTLQANT